MKTKPGPEIINTKLTLVKQAKALKFAVLVANLDLQRFVGGHILGDGPTQLSPSILGVLPGPVLVDLVFRV